MSEFKGFKIREWEWEFIDRGAESVWRLHNGPSSADYHNIGPIAALADAYHKLFARTDGDTVANLQEEIRRLRESARISDGHLREANHTVDKLAGKVEALREALRIVAGREEMPF